MSLIGYMLLGPAGALLRNLRNLRNLRDMVVQDMTATTTIAAAAETHERPFGKQLFFNHLAVELNVIPKKVSASNMNELSPEFIEYMSSNNNKRINNVLMLANNNTID